MAEVQGDESGLEGDPFPEEGPVDPEEGGEGEIGGGGDDEEEEDVDGLASFLESEILSGSSAEDTIDKQEEEEGDAAKNKRKQDSGSDGDGGNGSGSEEGEQNKRMRREERRRQAKGKAVAPQIDTGMFSSIPPELFLQIFKFLSSEDLISCALVCRFMNAAASDETLWRRLYCMRWGLASNAKFRECAWKNLYIQRDREDMVEFVRNTPTEFREYYIQMQASKRSQAPLPSEVNDDKVILDKTIADQVSTWKSSRGLTDESVKGHSCSGNTCSYTQIGDAYICEKTGRVHVGCFFVRYLGTALRGGCVLMMNGTLMILISNKVVLLMNQSRSWDLDDSPGQLCWVTTALMRRNLSRPCVSVDMPCITDLLSECPSTLGT
ncbi:hypothetical protein PVAP13_4NG320400 [Panicum virgatum]|uniref:F-box domain-containing protein n=1 Tax=Panicum virgatum TaxID=38727 RepID=A0A8T0TFQ3_PANVG|nr:hypothetical protein PVAP13_4NG320400 [Panicum virgatum]